ncbi:hypothetical protein L1987_74462 [Smallanthus sonchifolius]|uniref:Uncharacterized protein n=1 Tax=Smallanthus sonchifolius TaxID=185202 RepID=A0ACB9A3Z2_9ASTR|nr:hypothetical protein L1987_74462 [Smallanthus sonchifolius]
MLIRDSNCFVYTRDFETGDYGPQIIVPLPFQVGIKDVPILAHLDDLLCVCLHNTNELVLWNLTTTAYMHLSTSNSHGRYEDIANTLGLYNGPSNDYNVLHVRDKLPSCPITMHFPRHFGKRTKLPSNGSYDWHAGYVTQTLACKGTAELASSQLL